MTRKSKIPVFPKTDKRLLGTWKSDKGRTFREWLWAKKFSPQKKARYRAIWGTYEVTYTRTNVILKPRRQKWELARRYSVLAADDLSVVIVEFGEFKTKNRRAYEPANLKGLNESLGSIPNIRQIHFEKNHYWISLGNSKNREFFRKI